MDLGADLADATAVATSVEHHEYVPSLLLAYLHSGCVLICGLAPVLCDECQPEPTAMPP